MDVDGNLRNEVQSLYCTNCGKMLEFKIKPEKTGKLIIVCDHCGHKHFRYVENGVVTSERWDGGGISGRSETASKKFGVMRNAS
jgi:RNase P subunit RPR2